MLHWPKKSLVIPFYYINFDQNGPPYAWLTNPDELLLNKPDLIEVPFNCNQMMNWRWMKKLFICVEFKLYQLNNEYE